MDLYIFRHGVTYFSKTGNIYGNQIESAEILDEGKPVIEKLGQFLRSVETVKNFTSPYKRCLQTVEIVTDASGKEFEVNSDLRDWNPQAEKVNTMIERIENFCRYLEKSNFTSVAVCTHGFPINAIIAYFTKGRISEKDLPNFPDPGVLVKIEAGKVSYIDFNE